MDIIGDLIFDSHIQVERDGDAPKQMPLDKAGRLAWNIHNRTYIVNKKDEEVRWWFLPPGCRIPDRVYCQFLSNYRVVDRLTILGQLGKDPLETMLAQGWVSPLDDNPELFWVTRKAWSELGLSCRVAAIRE